MRKVTEVAVNALLNAEKFNSGNTKVEVLPNVSILSLHGNDIAFLYNNPERTLSITNAGWATNTTKDRLNALPNVKIQVVKGNWFLNGKKWDGSLIDVKNQIHY